MLIINLQSFYCADKNYCFIGNGVEVCSYWIPGNSISNLADQNIVTNDFNFCLNLFAKKVQKVGFFCDGLNLCGLGVNFDEDIRKKRKQNGFVIHTTSCSIFVKAEESNCDEIKTKLYESQIIEGKYPLETLTNINKGKFFTFAIVKQKVSGAVLPGSFSPFHLVFNDEKAIMFFFGYELGPKCITHRVISDRVHRLLVTLSYFRPDRFVQLLSLIPILILLLYYLVSGCLTSLC